MIEAESWKSQHEELRVKLLGKLQHLTKEQAIARLAGFLAAAEMMMIYNTDARTAKELLMFGILKHPDETVNVLERSNC